MKTAIIVTDQCNCGNRITPAGMPHGCGICNPAGWTFTIPANPCQLTGINVGQLDKSKPFTVAIIRDLQKQVLQGEISLSRMVEILNEKAAQ